MIRGPRRETWSKAGWWLWAAALSVVILCFAFACSDSAGPDTPAIILDTDLSSDVDDAGAVAVLHALADRGEADILAMMISSGDPWSGPCLDALNTSFGRPDIPIGVINPAEVIDESKYTAYIANHFHHDFSLADDREDAFLLYRKILAQQPDNSVSIVTIGYLSNLARLLNSGPDQYSPLDGLALVKTKVKRLVCMGGKFPKGREWNFYRDAGATVATMQRWPTPITFVGFEIGSRVKTGKALREVSETQPLRVAYQRYNQTSNRESWDQVAVLVAVHPEKSRPKYWSLAKPGRVVVEEDGSNTWQSEAKGQGRYLLWNEHSDQLAPMIDLLMVEAAGSAR
jgi:purine nucleosidase